MIAQLPPATLARQSKVRKSMLARWSLRASLGTILLSVASVLAAVMVNQFGVPMPAWAPEALTLGPEIGLSLAGVGAALSALEMLRAAKHWRQFDPGEHAKEFALDDASEALATVRQGCLARIVVPFGLLISVLALSLELLSPPAASTLQVFLLNPLQDCSVALRPFTLELDNTASTLATTWSATPVETLADGSPWAAIQPAHGTLAARQRRDVQVIPNLLVCRFTSSPLHVGAGQARMLAYASASPAATNAFHVQITSDGVSHRTTMLATYFSSRTDTPTPPLTATPTNTPTPKPTNTPTPKPTNTPTPKPTNTPTPKPTSTPIPHVDLAVQNQAFSETCTNTPPIAYTITLDNRGSNVPIHWLFVASDGWATASPSSSTVGAGNVSTILVSPNVCPIGSDATVYQATLVLSFPQGGSQLNPQLTDTIFGPHPLADLQVTQGRDAFVNCVSTYTIIVDNLGGNVPVTWQFVPVEYNGATPWAVASPPVGTLAAGQGSTSIVVSFQPWTSWEPTYHATLRLTFPAGGSQPDIPLTASGGCLI